MFRTKVAMTRLNLELSDEQSQFVSGLVTHWDYPDANAVLKVALSKMQADHDAKVAALRQALQEGEESGIYDGDPFEDIWKEMGWTR